MRHPRDRTDLALLALLQQDNRRPLRDLAAELGVSAPTCLRRIRRMEKAGIIRGHAALLDAAKLGLGVSAYIEVSLANASGAAIAGFERRIGRCPEVIQCAEIAGDSDFLLTVVARDMEAFGEFARRHLAGDNGVRSYRTLLVLRRSKHEHRLPLPA